MIHWNSTSYQYLVLLTDVYLSLNGTVIPNHGYVNISGIGYNDDSALLCHTNRPPGSTNSGGNWWAPTGTRVYVTDVPGVTISRGSMVVRLKRRVSGDPPEGIYRCTINDAASTPQMVYVGLYNTGRGITSALQISFSTCPTIQAASLYLPYLHTLISMETVLSSPSPASPLEDLLPLSLGPETPSLSLKELRLC